MRGTMIGLVIGSTIAGILGLGDMAFTAGMAFGFLFVAIAHHDQVFK